MLQQTVNLECDLSRVIGPPGTGKTTYLTRQVKAAWDAGRKVMLCSLTKAAAAELTGRNLPIEDRAVGTLHSHAFHSLVNGFTGIADTPAYIAEWNQGVRSSWKLSGGDRDLDEDNLNPTTALPGDELYQDIQVRRAQMIREESWLDGERAFYKAWSEWKKENDLLDFTDLLETCLRDIPHAPNNPDVIFVDECQDLSKLEMTLIYKWAAAAGYVVQCGDPWQALFEWRGSDPEVFYMGNARAERVLEQSYRVPKAVHKAAIDWMRRMPDYSPIEYRPTESEGEVKQIESNYKEAYGIIPTIERSLLDGKSVMYLTSCNYMLDPMISALRNTGIPFQNQYRRRQGKWNPLQRRKGSTPAVDRVGAFLKLGEEGAWFRNDLKTWLSAMNCSQILPSKKGFKSFESVIDSLPQGLEGIAYDDLIHHLGEEVVNAAMAGDCTWMAEHVSSARKPSMEFVAAIANWGGVEALQKEPGVTIGTIHSVKGGEADVVIVAPDVSGRSYDAIEDASTFRLFYVAMTRARESLHILEPVYSPLSVALLGEEE